MYIAFISLLFSAIYYASTHILYAGWDIGGHERVNDSTLNANKLAYYTFYSTISFYFLAEISKKNKSLNKAFRILFLAMIPTSFWIALITASRQVLIIQTPTILILGYIRYFTSVKLRSAAISLIVVVGVVVLFASTVESIYSNSYLAQRNEISLDEDSRPKLMAEAIQVGFEHPIFGVGPGNYCLVSKDGRYSHCTYTELFANTGFLGFLLYAILLLKFFFVNYRRFRSTRDNYYLSYMTFALIFIFYNIFYVFYKDMWLTAFFFLVAADSEFYYKNQKKYRINGNPRKTN